MRMICGSLVIPSANNNLRVSPGLGVVLSNRRWGLEPKRLTMVIQNDKSYGETGKTELNTSPPKGDNNNTLA